MKINWKKYLCMLAMVCVLLSGMVFPVFAEESGDFEPVGFILEDELYVFLEADGEEEVTLSLYDINAKGNNKVLKPFKDSGQYVHYFLLLDRSGSMKKFMPQKQISEFSGSLLENTEARTRVSLLSLGDTFEVEMGDAEDKNAVLKKLDQLSYDGRKTNLYDGINSALNHVEGKDRRGGELYYIILITDGEPDGEAEEATFAQIEERIKNTKDVIFTTLRLGEETDAKSISFGKNMTGQDVSSVASEIAQTVNEMYTVCFKLEGEPTEAALDITLISKEKTWGITGVPVVRGRKSEPVEETAAGERDLEREQEAEKDSLEKLLPGGKNNTEKELPEETEESEDQQLEEAKESKEQSAEDIDEFREQISEDSEQKQQGRFGQLLRYILFLLGGIVFGCGLALFWKKKQKNLRPTERRSRAEDGKGILLGVEVISGRCRTKKRNFSLHRDVLIGCGRNCDIVWEDADISEQNSRIFTRDGIVYIEDLDSRYGTAINGMRIYTQNRLRDGDVISIGRIQFRVLL